MVMVHAVKMLIVSKTQKILTVQLLDFAFQMIVEVMVARLVRC